MRPLLPALLVAGLLCWPARSLPLDALSPRGNNAKPGPRRRPASGWARRRAHLVTAEDVLALLEGLAPALRVGLTPAEALALVVRMNLGRPSVAGRGRPGWQQQLAAVGRLARAGVPLAPAWRELATAHRSPELLLLAQAWALSERLGSALSEAVDTASAMVRARLGQQRQVEAASAGARATMQLLTLLPLGGVVVALMVGVSPHALYLQSPAAIACLVLGLLLLLAGRWIVRRLVRRCIEPAPIT